MHWLMVAALFISLSTGLRITVDQEAPGWRAWLEPLLLQGEVGHLHVLSATVLLAVACAYCIFLLRARLASRIKPNLAALRQRGSGRWYAVNRSLYWLAFLLLLLAGASGLVMYALPGLLPERVLAAIHQYTAWGFVAYLAIHIAAQLALGGMRQLLKIFAPRLAYGAAAAAALASAAAAAAMAIGMDRATVPELNIASTDLAPTLDGKADDAVWHKAQAVVIHTVRGANVDGGEVPVTVRALHDAEHAYFMFEWPDATYSMKHLPLLKTGAGWKVLESKYSINDENDYYEDKFSVMLSPHARIGGGASHLGSCPLPGKPEPQHQRGLHYTTDGSYVDVWHWKGVRSGGLNQFDDNYFGPPMDAPKPGKRYTGGYTQDPKSGGGFEQNWEKIKGSKLVSPKWLPKDLAAVQAQMGKLDLDPAHGDQGVLGMHKDDVVDYRPELDTYPVGTVIPSVVWTGPFKGDRGDVAAYAKWQNGIWRIEASRKLKTDSKYDQPIESGMYLWVAAFDHNQARHTRHERPVRLQLQ